MERGVLGTEYRDGDVICRQGDPGDRMYMIQAGRVVVCREDDGTEVPVAELTAGHVFGEMSIFDRKPRSATVRVKGAARILTLDKRAFLRGVHEDPSLAYRILEEMSLRIRRLDEEISWLKRGAAEARAPGSPPGCTVVVPRGELELCARLVERFSQEARVHVVLDRRVAERRQRPGPHDAERRRADRRGGQRAPAAHLASH
jgi:CRP-like cAMP-binding protein